MKKITIIGGGPAALMLAAELNTEKYEVILADKKKTVGRKFLVAGEGGLNLTYNSPIDELISNYFPSEFIYPILRQFTNEDLIKWLNTHEIPTFIGSSNRVFPTMDMKPIEVLNKLVEIITNKDVTFEMEAEWLGWSEDGLLQIDDFDDFQSDITVFALGGASWKVTGSDGNWSEAFENRGIKVLPFRAANCAFGVDWNKNFIATHKGKPLKNIALTFGEDVSKGELVVTEFGIEGNAIYALSQKIQDTLLETENTVVYLDLKPTMTVEQIATKIKGSEFLKMTDILKEDINLDRTSIGLLKQFTDKETFANPEKLAEIIKSVPVAIKATDDIDKAISTLGGIDLNELDSNLQLKKIPNTYAIGEMLDWYAPTGGYLMQACFSMGYGLAQHLNALED